MNIKRQLKHKREAKIAFDNSRTSGKIHIICHARPFREIGSLCGGEYLLAVQKRMLFRKLAKNKLKPTYIASIQNWKIGQTISFLSEETDIFERICEKRGD